LEWETVLVLSYNKSRQDTASEMAAPRTQFVTVTDVDALIVDGGVLNHPTIYCTIRGSPSAQERHRVLRLLGGRVRVYDPSARSKRALKRAIRSAMAELGCSDFPFFQGEDRKFKFTATFGLSNMAKDVDNLLKFLMDGLESVVYVNDRAICDVRGTKVSEQINNQYTRFEIEEIFE
jgi:Holliday junction resolvase RusA-like endonuclease